MKGIALVTLLVIILASGVAWGQTTPGVGAGFVYTFSGDFVRPSLNWTITLTKAPSILVSADGLLTTDGTYGLGVSTPIATITDPFFRLVHVYPSDSFQQVLGTVSIGGAVLTENLRDFDGGLFAKVTVFSITP